MIDMNKQYTYNGKPVRIYADGRDTTGGVHCAVMNNTLLWEAMDISESDLVEVWQPKKGDLVWCWDEIGFMSVGKYLINTDNGYSIGEIRDDMCHAYFINISPFTGTLPEAFKGL